MRVPITGLVGHPGETRELTREVPVEEFGSDPWGPAVAAVLDPVVLELHLDSVVEGILVRGMLGFTVELPCARCLEPQHVARRVEVTELFLDPTRRDEDDADDEDDPGYELIDDLTAIDLSVMVRDALVVDLPLRVLCRDDCRGLCPMCGADRNVVDCGHRDGTEPDPRWSALADLDLPPE